MVEQTSHYGGEIILEFDSVKHTYRVIRGSRRYKVPSSTKITGIVDKSGPLVGWAINQTIDTIRGAIGPGAEYSETYLEAVFKAAKGRARGSKDEAASIGKQVHEWIEHYTAGETDLVLPAEGTSVRGGVDAFNKWLSQHHVEFIERERRCYSRRHRYSGTLDAVARVDGRLTLLDYKTSNGIYAEYILQAASYCIAYEEETGARLEKAIILKLGKEDGEFTTHEFDTRVLRRARGAFLSALNLWRQLERLKKQL